MNFDEDGNIENMIYIKSFGFKLKVLIGRNDKLVCDQMVFKRDLYSNYEWSQIHSLEVDHYVSACFACDEDLVFGLQSGSKVVSFRYQPND